MKYFVISDIHSHYKAMILSLQKAGFNEKNMNHHLIVLGDLFDRGDNAREVYLYLSSLSKNQKATMIIGNHDLFLLDFLNMNFDKVQFNMNHNGFDKTLEQFSGLDPYQYSLKEIHQKIHDDFPNLKNWLSSFLRFFEIGNYIFVHGGIDGSKKDWKQTPTYELVWNREIQMKPIKDKIVVAGHHRTATIRSGRNDYEQLYKNHPEKFDILYKEGKVLIDRFVEVSNSLNVLVLENI